MRSLIDVQAPSHDAGSLQQQTRRCSRAGSTRTPVRFRTVGKHGWPTAGHSGPLTTTAGR